MNEMKIITYSEDKKIPFLNVDLFIDIESSMRDINGNVINLSMFNAITSLNVDDVRILTKITYGTMKMAPFYWQYLKVLESIVGVDSPESIILCPKKPIESLEYPGFFIIPEFTNYVISKNGRLIKKSDGVEIKASETNLGYYTFRMTGDDGKTQNQLRHRILSLTFHEYPFNVDDLDVNHKNGIPGSDDLSNLEWVTRSENMHHAYEMGLRTDNKPIDVRDTNTGKVLNFYSCSAAARYLKLVPTTVVNRASTNGYKSFDGFQYRFRQFFTDWPDLTVSSGMYRVTFENGEFKDCSCIEAARLVGLTRTSLLRALREGRNKGNNKNTVKRIK